MTRITIGNEEFTVHKSKYASINRVLLYGGRDLHSCYTKPSSTKLAIYREWAKWAVDNNVKHFGVNSYNCHRFSLQGLIKIDENWYIVDITASHNKLYLVEDKIEEN